MSFRFQYDFGAQSFADRVRQGGPHPLRAIGYRLRPEDEELTPLIDGKTGGLVAFTKAEVYAAGYGQDNEAARVLRAMEKFNEIRLVDVR